MRHHPALIAMAAGIVLWSAPGFAQTKCPEGKTLIGTCANAARSEELRRQTIVFTQPKLSYTGAPVLAGIERRYDAIRDRRLGLEYELFGPFGGGATGPVTPCPARRC
jgi:hypothetical protein